MTERFDKLRNTVLSEIRKKHSKQPHPNHMKVLGTFITANLNRQRRSPNDLAQKLSVPVTVIDLLQRGELPEWMLSDRFVVRLAHAISYEPNILRIMMGREIVPTMDEGEKQHRHARRSGQE